MKLIDYTGKLNSHEDFIKIIDKLEAVTEFIEIVILDEKESNSLVDEFNKDIIYKKKVSSWWGTKTESVNNLYRLRSSKALFNKLRMYETFCKYYDASIYKLDWDKWEATDFGIDDIAFYDVNGNYLLYVTTHEGYITISRDIIYS